MTEKRVTQVLALFVFAVAAAVYWITQTPTCPFWDSGEFIAVSYILGIPHPPGTPFYVLLGRMATLLMPWPSIAERVNALSGLSSALAVMFTFLVTRKFISLVQGKERQGSDRWIAHAGAVIAAFMIAFSDSFWENSIEAEVYALMSLAQIMVLWLGLRWWEQHEVRPTAGPLMLATYVMWLCVGLHLGVALMAIPLLVLVFLVDRRVALVFLMPFMTSLLVTMGMERLAGGVLFFAMFTFLVYAWQEKINGWVVAGGAVASIIGMFVAFGDSEFKPHTAILAALGVLVPLGILARKHREGRILALALLMMIVGYSTHVYLPIRAAQHPAVNEGSPANWETLRDLLERKQYGSMNPMSRRGKVWETQINKEFLRYFTRQWPVVPSPRPAGPAFPVDEPIRGALPILLGLAGAVWHLRRERVSFACQFLFVGITTVGMVVFLNFSDNEVRERDYFFQSGYHAYSIWIGMGAAFVVTWVRDSFQAGTARFAVTAATAALLALQPLGLLWNLWYTHDRRGNYIARDYAYNMLAPLAPNAFVFTNGDNDTFPLWYIQEVEGFRKDVRVVNLSLLNTDWYIQQLKNEEPKIPIQLDDQTIKLLGRGAVQDETGRVFYTNQFMVHHIMDQNRTADGKWKKPPYFAVTVPEHMGLDPFFTLEGLVYRVNTDSLQADFDAARTRDLLYNKFLYRGLFEKDGSWNTKVYKDENSSTLSHNYAMAHIQLSFSYRKSGDLAGAINEMERVVRMFPDLVQAQLPLGSFYVEHGDIEKALALYRKAIEREPNDPEVRYYYGTALLAAKQLDAAMKEFDTAIQGDPNYNLPYYESYLALWDAGQQERALSYLDRWVSLHPDDVRAAALLNERRRQIGQPALERSQRPAPPLLPPVP